MSNQNIDPSPEDTIPLDEAIGYANNWANFIFPSAGSGYLRAFYIPIDDIVNLAQFHSAEAVHGYIGLTDPNDPTSVKMMLVPISPRNVDITSLPDGQSTIYDYTQPCPQACDFTSPLYTNVE